MIRRAGVQTRARRVGFALPAAIIALVLLSALVVGGLFIAIEELRAGRTDVASERALAAAEWGLARAVVGWDASRNAAVAVGATVDVIDAALAEGDRVTVRATRTQRSAFWLTSRATSAGDGRTVPARHTVGQSLRLVGPTFPRLAALTAAGQVSVTGGGRIDGADAEPPSGGAPFCAGSAQSVAGIAVPSASLACGTTCDGETPPGVTGSPPVAVAALPVGDATRQPFGDETRETLARRATIVSGGGTLAPRPSVAGAECDRADPLNWGDPFSGGPCRSYLPIVSVRGSAVLAGGSVGQGVLLVDGDLQVEPGARFAGVVLAGGAITVRGVGAELVGIAFAGGAGPSGASRVADGGAVRFASCPVDRATLAAARLVRTPGRWWAELR